jgi:hypothetical protein
LSASRLRTLSWADRALLLEAVTCLALVRAAVLVLPFRRIEPWLGRRMTESPLDGHYGDLPLQVAWTIEVAAKRTPWRSKCLEQAIAAKLMLRRRGVPSTMYLGVARSRDAHAWLRVGPVDLIGGAGRERFAVVATFAEPDLS